MWYLLPKEEYRMIERCLTPKGVLIILAGKINCIKYATKNTFFRAYINGWRSPLLYRWIGNRRQVPVCVVFHA